MQFYLWFGVIFVVGMVGLGLANAAATGDYSVVREGISCVALIGIVVVLFWAFRRRR